MTNQWFANQEVILDGKRFAKCTFVDCRLIYTGGEIPDLSACQFTGCTWDFEGAALRTLAYLTLISMIGAKDVVVAQFREIVGAEDFPESKDDPVM